MKLNGWQRIGIIISVLWAIGGGLYGRYLVSERLINMSKNGYKACAQMSANGSENFAHCISSQDTEIKDVSNNTEYDPLIFALVPIPFGWLIAYGMMGIIRWVGIGFVRGQKI